MGNLASLNEVISSNHILLVHKLNHTPLLCDDGGVSFYFLEKLMFFNLHAMIFASESHCKYD